MTKTINELKMASRLSEVSKLMSQVSAKLSTIKGDALRDLAGANVTIDLESLSLQADGMNEDIGFALGTLEVMAAKQDAAKLS